ncbi:alkaline phosphatase D family protein [Allonocardiopsis opalescens]|uniref:Alkaline phosphatase D n=1 Tax=Allonocardiopsis opalescens TaxID=1144618 RepID=A0A2T0QDF3_9ACTN|nr:alkaline phosphatase D family protein [Allonocardiopsis opalescens]PRY01901.1 alkaline phosphatase D [Allonocardiopsis opalescens]
MSESPAPETPAQEPPAPPLSRRTALRYGVLGAGAAVTAGLLGAAPAGAAAPALVHRGRPELTHGIQLGDPRADGAVVWARADRPARMVVEVSSRPDFRDARRVRGPLLTPETDGTGRLRLRGLRPGSHVHVRVTATDPDGRLASAPVTGGFRTVGRRDIRFLWSGDVAGQGFGINPDLGGMPIYRAMARREPDFFLHSGDTVYADGPLVEALTLPDGRVYRNLVTPEKQKVAETLAEFRGQYAYNLLDEGVRAFAAQVPQIVQWDDHEVTNNWWPGEVLTDARYTERRVDVLAARAHRAFHEWQPIRPSEAVDGRIYRKISYGPDLDVFVIDMRPYREPNSAGTSGYERVLGDRQARWLAHGLDRSRATWKIVASDMPIGVVVPDGEVIEGVANDRPGAPNGREAELAWVLREIHRARVRNVVWLTADVHYTAAHHYAPERASFRDFSPFWEFVSGPLHAGAFGPNRLDPTFGPRVEFVNAPPNAATSPMDGFQHFGEVNIDAGSGDLRVDLRDIDGRSLWSTTLRPEGRR